MVDTAWRVDKAMDENGKHPCLPFIAHNLIHTSTTDEWFIDNNNNFFINK